MAGITSDTLHDEIRDLIVQTKEPKDKAMLLILLRIAENLSDNTQITKRLSEELKEHIENFREHERIEMELINQGRGAWKAAIIALAVLQAIAAWYLHNNDDDIKHISTDIQSLKEFRAEHNGTHKSPKEAP